MHARTSINVLFYASKFLAAATAAGTGRGATIYVVDSGVRVSHQEFRTQDGSRTRASHGQ